MGEEIKSKLEMDSARFLTVISMFSASAYQSMGKLANPMTGKSERNLEAAQGFIDILRMLKKKTAGNLSSEESRIMEGAISDLELNFVQEKNKPEPAKEEEKPEEKPEVKEEKKEAEPEAKEKKASPEEERKGEKEEGAAEKGEEEQGEAGGSGDQEIGESGKQETGGSEKSEEASADKKPEPPPAAEKEKT